MKFTTVLTLSLLSVTSTFAFVPRAFVATNKYDVKLFEQSEGTEEEVLEKAIQEELKKGQKVSKFKNDKGMDFAPWLQMSEKDEQDLRFVVKDREAARQRRLEEEKRVSGALRSDSQAQELSGAGLRSKIVDEESVELEWNTNREANTAGFLIKRRAAKTENFEVIATYEDWGPLVSKGFDGGTYRFLDTTVSPGSWVYRVTECEKNGNENDLSQCLVDIQTEDEKFAALVAVGGIGGLLVSAVLAGALLDPNGGF